VQFFAGDNLSGLLQQGYENVERLSGQLDFQPATAQFAGPQIYLEAPEANDVIARRRYGRLGWTHCVFHQVAPS
jgi:hypothetical protein